MGYRIKTTCSKKFKMYLQFTVLGSWWIYCLIALNLSISLDNRITKQIHKGRAVSGPNDDLHTISTSKRGRVGLKKFSGTKRTDGIHTWISSGETLDMSQRWIYYKTKKKEKSKGMVTFGEVDSRGELVYCFDVKSERGLAKELDTYFPPHSPACEMDYNDIDGPSRCWEQAIMRIPNSANRTLDIFSTENGKNIAEISCADLCPTPEKIHMNSAPFSDVTCYSNGETFLTLSKSSFPKNVIYDFFVLKYPPAKISHRIQIMQSVKKGKNGRLILEKVEVMGEFMLGYGVGKKCQDIMYYDLEVILEQFAEFFPGGLGDWRIKTYVIRELPKPLFTVSTCKSFHVFNPSSMPAYYMVRSPRGFQVFEEALTEKKFVYEIKLLSNMEDKLEAAFMTSEMEPRIAVLEEHNFRIFAINRQDNGTSTCDLVFSKDFNVDDESEDVENGTENAEHKGTRKSSRKKKHVYYQEYFGLAWDENSHLMQFALIKFTETTVVCYVYDSVHFKLQYILEPKFFKPGDSVDLRSAIVSFNDNNIFVRVKCDTKSHIFVFNLVAESHVHTR